MSDEFDIMKPIDTHLDVGKTMFDEPEPQAPQAPPSVHPSYGHVTAEEQEFLSELPPQNNAACSGDMKAPTVSATPVGDELREVLDEMELLQLLDAERLSRMTVRVNGREVHGKIKKAAIVSIVSFIAVFLVIFVVVAANVANG
ncbi:MAG: hypothetical protein J6A16_06805 [Oscillospiraceae bacterium]|nr:hypothetical protein [Oscillospiraceae bacterium]